jgi:hypothetical protein
MAKKLKTATRRRGTIKGSQEAIVSRARATKILAQGVGAVPRRAFGITKKTSIPRGLTPACWNAHSPVHAGLPRAVGPYTVVRTTTLITSKSPFMMFGTFSVPGAPSVTTPDHLFLGHPTGGPKLWTNICAVGAKEDITESEFNSSSIGNHAVSSIYQIPVPGTEANGIFAYDTETGGTPKFSANTANTTAVPSALSVQVINPNPMQGAEGTAAAAVCPVRLDLMNSDKSWGRVGGELVSYYQPRVLSGGKLALRGVQMDSLPLSMTDVSDFRELWRVDPLVSAPSSLYWSGATKEQDIQGGPALTAAQKSFRASFTPEGWAPIVYYSPSAAVQTPSERQPMTFLVTMEWRVRFDISNPACASHKMHKPSTDNEWHNMIQKASSALPGVIDIADKVADAGMRIAAKYAALGA